MNYINDKRRNDYYNQNSNPYLERRNNYNQIIQSNNYDNIYGVLGQNNYNNNYRNYFN